MYITDPEYHAQVRFCFQELRHLPTSTYESKLDVLMTMIIMTACYGHQQG